VEEFIREQRRTSCSAQIRIPSAAFSLVIGPKGAKAQEIQQASGAKFDLDRTKNMGIVKGT
jgi:polyribonucleotide nucleotidyltransferase